MCNNANDTRQSSLPAIDPQKLAIIQLLLQQGVPLEQVTAILSQTQPAQASQPPFPLSPDRYGRRRDSRSRSRSPPPRSPYRAGSPPRGRGRGRRRESFDSPPPRRRRSPSYDDYRGNRRSPSRSRSPPTRKARSPPRKERSPVRKGLPQIDPQDYKPRYIEWDDSLKPDRIRGIFANGSVANDSIESNVVCGRSYEPYYRRQITGIIFTVWWCTKYHYESGKTLCISENVYSRRSYQCSRRNGTVSYR